MSRLDGEGRSAEAELLGALAASEAAWAQAEAQNEALRSELAATHDRLARMLHRRQSGAEGVIQTLEAPQPHSALAPGTSLHCTSVGVESASCPTEVQTEPTATVTQELRRRARALGLSEDALFRRRRGAEDAGAS